MTVNEDFLTIYCDPGEDFGWCVGRGLRLLSAGTTKMWTTADELWDALNGQESIFRDVSYARKGVTEDDFKYPIKRVVAENFRIYPWAAQALAWDEVRTARVIGALTFMCRVHQIPFITQPAAIKKAAQSAGAEELYYRPLRENRHQNDAIQHFVFYTNTELMGVKMPVPAVSSDERS